MTAEGTGQGEQGTKQGEGQGQQGEMVPKAEFDKLVSETADLRKGRDSVKRDLEAAKTELLSQDYLAYLESKEQGKSGQTKQSSSAADIESLSRKEFLDLLKEDFSEILSEFRKNNIDPLKLSVSDLYALEEVRQCRAEFSDFDELKEEIRDRIKSDSSLTIRNAYKIVKQDKKLEKDADEKRVATQAAREKPGGASSESAENRTFKDKTSAAEDAWERAVGDRQIL